jgi:site-specific DNA recombinase|tara:strand:- start:36 stop:737 length:702 start_codon:yes stop_codon:yes gene_type:complete
MKSVIGYIRCSTRLQAEEGVSLDLQKSMIENYCKINKLELVEVYSDEGVSGKGTTNRTGYGKVMELVEQAAITGVVVYSISRFGRNLVDTLNSVKVMTDNDISFLSVKENINTKTSQGRLQLNIYSSVAEYEREEIVTRIKDSLNHKKENGEKFCRSVFGLKVVKGKFVKCDKEVKVRRRIKLLHNKGYSLYNIANKLNDDGVKTSLGSVWYRQTIKNVLNTNINDYINKQTG